MSTPLTDRLPSGQVKLLAQADMMLLMAGLFSVPSIREYDGLQAEWSTFEELLAQADIPNRVVVADLLKQVRGEAQGVGLSAWAGEYNRLFEGAALCSLYESGFIRRDKGAILADIAGFYHAFGFTLADNAGEKVDHVVCELEFVALLLVMLAKAQDQGMVEAARITYEALGTFNVDHLGEWMSVFCDRLVALTVLPLYRHVARMLFEVWSGMVMANGLPTVDGVAVVPVVEEVGTPYECDRVG